MNSRQDGTQETKQDQPVQEVGQEEASVAQAEPLDQKGSLVASNDKPQTLAEAPGDAEAALEQDAKTDPLEPATVGAENRTIPLSDQGEIPPLPALDTKTVVGDRYRIEAVLGVLHGTNLYRVTDMQGYRVCWACGSSASQDGDTYCVECGAQLTGRFYRLQEFNAAPPKESASDAHPEPGLDSGGEEAQELEPAPPLPEPILDNAVQGIARVYDAFIYPDLGRAYVVWEEVYGRSLASWLEGEVGLLSSPRTASGHLIEMADPEEDQILGWMAQSAEILAELHSHGIAGCEITPDNLVVQPGDRLALVDPSACEYHTAADGRASIEPAAQASDIRNLAMALERWYIAIREDSLQAEGQNQHPHYAHAQAQEMVSSADEVTGPLGSISDPAVILAKAREGAYPSAEELAQALYDLYEENKPLTNLELWSGHVSDLGKVRQINEDSLLTLEANVLEHEGGLSAGLYVIADGMGGHQSGEVASSIAARTIGSVVNSAFLGPLAAGDPVATDQATCSGLLQQAVLEANRRIHELAKERNSDLGTTVTVALVVGSQLYVANVGDSRTYMWREGQLGAITRDHSLVAQLVAAGQLTQDEIYTHPRRNEIYRALGDPHLTIDEIDIFARHLQPGDSVLMCSDGLWDFVRDPIINTTIGNNQDKDPRAICQVLVDLANEAGGEDNISTILVRVLGG